MAAQCPALLCACLSDRHNQPFWDLEMEEMGGLWPGRHVGPHWRSQFSLYPTDTDTVQADFFRHSIRDCIFPAAAFGLAKAGVKKP